MASLVREFLVHRPLPDNPSIAATDGEDHKFVMMHHRRVVVRAGSVARVQPVVAVARYYE